MKCPLPSILSPSIRGETKEAADEYAPEC